MHPLDNVIWNALTTRQAHLAERRGSASRFHRDVSMLGGLEQPDPEAYACMASLLDVGEQVGLFLDEAQATPQLEVARSLPLLQMLRDNPEPPQLAGDEPAPVIRALTAADVPQMMALAELTKPGPFNIRTREMGDFVGIHSEGELVAMAGQRLHVPGYTELSGVCTHPEYLGRGYAAVLMTVLIRQILDRGERPLLHVLPDNTRAVALYERLGFSVRLRSRYVILQKLAP
jgi:ribosomal protein S18 acetylase RimI-like enzyme